ncbi:hypothetical protein PAAG_01175 [Paracoccidioides lutzii Pb01]|uniref:DNA damage-responsive protein 48 n=1 Tax=Paracoccidioides lutzii (strain ATCC MYA-826 / Pb01) TaxID=502779 RepID=C1GRN0_PARBA|nr:hypothetical protein PAAG_01175 [Paracoccidioides lutzii Pb01]EEH38254.1 hypothetical protein PAAG_01175 [Paracoccidioides lutzii Pb01]
MDFVNKITGREQQQQQPPKESSSDKKEGGGFLSGIGDRINTAAGGGKESEKNEDMLDKGIDFVQEHILGQGPQDNESALEQAKDEKISDFIRGQYKNTTGKELPIRDKETRFG